MSEAPPDWQERVRRACSAASFEALDSGVVRIELDLGAVGDALLQEHDSLPPDDGGPNSMHERGASLERLGWGRLAAQLRSGLVEPVRAQFYAATIGAPLERDYAYLVDYGERGDFDLGLHVDESDLTLNLCLGDWFEGGELEFCGLRCGSHRQTPPQPDELFAVDHAPGVGFVHLGAHRHRVPPLDQGRRRNLIVWCSSGATPLSAAEQCAPHCGHWPAE